MKNIIIYLNLFILLTAPSAFTQTMYVHTSMGVTDFNFSEIDSITFSLSPDPPAGSVAFFPFNNNVNDESGNGNHGTILGSATVNGFLQTGDNAVDALSIPNTVLDGASDFTISAKLRIDKLHTGAASPSTSNSWISGATSSNYNALLFEYHSDNDSWATSIMSAGISFATNNALEDGGWHHVIVLRSGTTAKLIIDGVEVGNGIQVEATQLAIDSGGLIIGQDQDSVGGGFAQNQSWAGGIDNLRFYRKALDNNEIQLLFQADGGGQ